MSSSLGPSGPKKQDSGWNHRSRPVIGVAGPNRGSWPAWLCIRLLIWWAGGKAIHITPSKPQPKLNLDGLVLSGGVDIHPERYEEKLIQTLKDESNKMRRWNHRMVLSVIVWLIRRIFALKSPLGPNESKLRDTLEFTLLEEAIKRNLPILGICRGAQLINVFYGGSLFQDTKPFYTEEPELHTVLPKQKVYIEEESCLHKIFARNVIQVNSLHFQAVNRIGNGLRIAAKDANGIVEAVEHPKMPFLVGVQWHPEFLWFQASQRQIFKNLVERARQTLDHRPAFS